MGVRPIDAAGREAADIVDLPTVTAPLARPGAAIGSLLAATKRRP
jgi:hypothetical protein